MQPRDSGPYLRPLDGLRAVAVVAVIVYHLGARWLPGGYFGVDVFFVISGFLITGIIRRQLAEGSFGLRAFFSRRIRRIVPALAAMLGVTGLIFCWLDPYRAGQFSESIRRSLLMQGNLAARDVAGGYWGANASGQPYLHIWSLGVEEQFYLLFPLIVAGLIFISAKERGPRQVVKTLAALGLGSFLWCVVSSFYWPEAAFYLLPARAWELLAGGGLAYALNGQMSDPVGPRRGLALSLTGGLLILGSFFYAPVQRVFLAAVPVVGSVLLIVGLHADHVVSRVLAGEPWGFLGRISYSLYLWHWPVILLVASPAAASAPLFAPGWREVATIGITLLVAAASFYGLERPLRGARHGVAIALLMGAVVFFGIGWTSTRLGPTPLRTEAEIDKGEFPPNPGGFPLIVIRGALYSSNPKMLKDEEVRRAPFMAINPPAPLPVYQPVRRLALTGAKRLVCWGDSHAMMFAPIFDEFAQSEGYRADFHIWWGGDPSMHRPVSRFGDNALVGWLKDTFSGDQVSQAEVVSFERCGMEIIRSRPDAVVFMMRYHDRDFSHYASTFDEILTKSRLIFIQQPPVLPIGDGYVPAYFAAQRELFGRDLDSLVLTERPDARAGRLRFEEAMRRRYAGAPNFHFLPTSEAFTLPSGGIRWRSAENALLYLDDDHITEEGARLIVRELAPVLK